MKTVTLILILACLPWVGTTESALAYERISEEWVEKWREDLELARTEFPEAHANLFEKMTKEQFESELTALSARLPQLSHQEIVMELARIVVLVQDGHSRVTLPLAQNQDFFQGHSSTPDPEIPGLLFCAYPVRLGLYSDGVFVKEIDAENAEYAGARVIRIGELTIEEAMAAVEPVIHRDNEMQVKDLMPSRLVIPEVLYARGVVADPENAGFELETPEGKKILLTLRPTAPDEMIEWVDARLPTEEAPLYLQDNDEYYWFEYLRNVRTIYLQYNTVENKEEESIAAFSKRLAQFIETNDVDKLIIDLRWNHGGDNTNNKALVRAITRSDKINRSGHLFAIVGRSTFSAAMMLSVDLEKWTQVLFVGEATGSSPIHYGDSRKLRLPNSGITVRLSTLYWQYSRPGDERPWIAPHLPAELSSTDYRENRDPAMDTILEDRADDPAGNSLGGRWNGVIQLMGKQRKLDFHFKYSDGRWTGDLSVPSLASHAMTLEQISITAENLYCELPVQNGTLVFKAEQSGGRLYGSADKDGIEIPYVLWRPE